MNIQSIKDCDPMKFSKETGPHYVSNINERINITECYFCVYLFLFY